MLTREKFVTDGVAQGIRLLAGRYQVGNLIGRGGMADVHIGTDSRLGRRVAIKLLKPALATDPAFRVRFRREAQDAAKMAHPTIVRIFDAGEETVRDATGAELQIPFIIMEFVDGRLLTDVIAEGPLEPAESVRITADVLTALEYSHRAGLVHRDIKPGNVMITTGGQVKVMDFGIARAVAESSATIAQTSTIMGTAAYFSPEQARGEAVDARTDLYSTGIMLFEMLTGRTPFVDENPVAVAYQHVNQPVPAPSSINPRVSPALDAVVMRALAKDPGERFQSADAFIAALDAALKEPGAGDGTADFAALPPAVAVPVEEEDDEGDEDRKRRNRWIAAAIAAVLIGVLIGLALTRDTSTEVPAVTGNQLNVAIALLQQDGFSVGEVKRVNREVAPNTVLEQDPAASPPGDEAALDCSFLTFFCSKPDVTLTVSNGPGSSKVPATAGLPREEAEEKLEAAGFDVDAETASSDAVEEGTVIHSEPSAGETATNGSAVTLVVSAGPKLTKVPVLVGTQRSVAVQQIRGRGLEPVISEEESSTPAGEVISQSPDAGSEVEAGSSVSIVVSAGEEQAKVPNVIGKLRAEAVQDVRDAGLSPTVEEEETEVAGKVGRAIDQFPPPGSELEPGDTVTIVVGKQAPAVPEEEEP